MLSRDQVKVMLVDRNLTAVANAIKVDRHTLYRFLRTGKCSVVTLEKLSEYLEGKKNVTADLPSN